METEVYFHRRPHDTFHPLIREFLAHQYAPGPKHHSCQEPRRTAVFAGKGIFERAVCVEIHLSVEVFKEQQPLLNKMLAGRNIKVLSKNMKQRNVRCQQK